MRSASRRAARGGPSEPDATTGGDGAGALRTAGPCRRGSRGNGVAATGDEASLASRGAGFGFLITLAATSRRTSSAPTASTPPTSAPSATTVPATGEGIRRSPCRSSPAGTWSSSTGDRPRHAIRPVRPRPRLADIGNDDADSHLKPPSSTEGRDPRRTGKSHSWACG